MMKEAWVSPETKVQQFVANEYVAACNNSSGTTYKFVCNATRDIQLTDTAAVYLSDGRYLGNFHQCQATHEVTVPQGTDMNSVFQDGYIQSAYLGGLLGSTQVVIWTDGGTDLHCTRNLKKDDWEITKS